MKRAVPLEISGPIDEGVLATQVSVNDAEVVPDGLLGLVEEDDATGLGRQLVEGLLPARED